MEGETGEAPQPEGGSGDIGPQAGVTLCVGGHLAFLRHQHLGGAFLGPGSSAFPTGRSPQTVVRGPGLCPRQHLLLAGLPRSGGSGVSMCTW